MTAPVHAVEEGGGGNLDLVGGKKGKEKRGEKTKQHTLFGEKNY